ncbi:MAG: N-acetylmuramoyl-L-alanine amidase family 2 [Chloroflexi bacterium]|nr:N-acetylmuramoyl-L-alanine amidase family 2 [Chloroflexota bacterium]
MKHSKSDQEKTPVLNPPKNHLTGYGEPLSAALRSRRHFLKAVGGVAALGAGIVALPLSASTLLAADGDYVVNSGFPARGIYFSPVKAISQTYNSVGSYWEVTSGDPNSLMFQVRGSKDGFNFSEWLDVSADNHEGTVQPAQARIYGTLQILDTPYVQFRLDIPEGMTVKLAGLTFIDTNSGPNLAEVPVPALPSGTPNKPYIISRADWGANEALRYNGKNVKWPPEYRTIKAIIVHHSETSNVYNADPSVEVRSIYRYHAITQGWGDIGYNYLIDWKGNIYEGRYGGDDVVAGHAYQYNYGSIGICLIGSFKSVKTTDAQLASLVKLIAWKAASKNLNPNGKTFLVDKTINVVSGHRDVINTSCPGNGAYGMLVDCRSKVAAVLSGAAVSKTYNVDLKSITFTPTTVKLGDTVKVEAVVTNTGTLPIETQDPAPGFIYEEGQTYETLEMIKQNGKFRLAIDFSNNSGISHPYRWGLGKALNPGETATITGYVKMRTVRQVDMFGGVIQEYVKYFEDNVGTTRIRTIMSGPNRTDRAPSRAADPNVRHFNETGHNLGYAFRKYWEENGGLALFGYPLTEEFTEESDTEKGKSFVVQYFQRNRFEFHPEFKGTKNEVLLGLLGVKLTTGRNFPKVPAVPSTDTKVYFEQTGHTLGGIFYTYWKANGSLPIFGYPISEEFKEKNPDDGKTYTVQYFERNRFEHHPENKGTQYEVLLGLLGTALCRTKGWVK